VGSQGSRLQPVKSSDVLKTTLDTLRESIREAGAEIEVVGPLPVVLADESQLFQVFQNLIGNAIKFRSADAPKIIVQVTPRTSSFVFSIKDNGIGIDMRYADRIFQMFQRLHDKRKYEGSGIGLAITKRIVERHGGQIWFESASGVGTTFFFTMHAARGSAAR
jgi:light-regulated signal transduction histidine kinase (bacteriophytochrome)